MKKIEIPNVLTLFRIFMIPVFLVFVFLGDGNSVFYRWTSMAIFLTVSLTDILDGYLARKWNVVSNFGSLMDPLADKMLVCSALIFLTSIGAIPAWMVIIIVCREFWVTALRQLALERGRNVISASFWGKLKTISQITMISTRLAGLHRYDILGAYSAHLAEFILWFSVVATIVSGAFYTRDYFAAQSDNHEK